VLLRRQEQRLDDLSFRMEAAMSGQLRQFESTVGELIAAVLRHDPRRALAEARESLAVCRTRLERSLERTLHRSTARLSALDARLHSLSPLAVLDRGYALVLDTNGALVRSTSQVARGDTVTTRISDGSFISRVESATNKSIKK
jgi:exodeoxyribonuclease VII large subunit